MCIRDRCSVCLQLDERMKCSRPNSEIEKNTTITEKRIHNLRSKCFYNILKENDPRVCTMSFNCQRNLPFTKLSDLATYYSGQFYLYNFTVVKGHSKSKLNSDNVDGN